MKRMATEQQITPQLHLRDPRTLNIEEYKGMGFDENNYSPIQPINRESPKNCSSQTYIDTKTR